MAAPTPHEDDAPLAYCAAGITYVSLGASFRLARRVSSTTSWPIASASSSVVMSAGALGPMGLTNVLTGAAHRCSPRWDSFGSYCTFASAPLVTPEGTNRR